MSNKLSKRQLDFIGFNCQLSGEAGLLLQELVDAPSALILSGRQFDLLTRLRALPPRAARTYPPGIQRNVW